PSDLVIFPAAAGKIAASSVAMIRRWLTEPRFADYAGEVAAHIVAGKWKELDDAFWTVIPFGTGGRRGKMYPIGSNAINDRTIGESAQGLADYVVDWAKQNTLTPALSQGERESRTEKQTLPTIPPLTAQTPVANAPGSPPLAPQPSPFTALSCAIAYDTRHRSRDFAELSAGIMAAAGFTVYFLDGVRSTPELSFAVR